MQRCGAGPCTWVVLVRHSVLLPASRCSGQGASARSQHPAKLCYCAKGLRGALVSKPSE